MSERIEINLEQGWAKGLRIVFEDAETSKSLNFDNTFYTKQVHGSKILSIGPSDSCGLVGEGDALHAKGPWFKDSKKRLLVKSSDCVPLIYVDRQSESVLCMHAGWRGLQKNIHLEPFKQGLCNPASTWVWAGPSLNGEDFEVGRDMFQLFGDRQDDTSVFALHTTDLDKRVFFPWALLQKDFEKSGVEVFYNVEMNTFQNLGFNSYRRAKKNGVKMESNYSWVSF